MVPSMVTISPALYSLEDIVASAWVMPGTAKNKAIAGINNKLNSLNAFFICPSVF